MPRGDKSKYTDKQERKADHIAQSYETRGVSEEDAFILAADPVHVAAMLPSDSLGALGGAAESLVSSGCVACAVNYAYSD